MNGGFGGATFQYVDDFDSEEEALKAAYDKVVEEYESYEGLHGLPSWEDVRDELRDSYGLDEEPSDDDINEVYLDYRNNWLDYKVEKVVRDYDVIEDDDEKEYEK